MSEVVSMCRGKSCCPEVVFHDDGSVTVQENDQQVHFSKESWSIFLEEVDKRRRG